MCNYDTCTSFLVCYLALHDRGGKAFIQMLPFRVGVSLCTTANGTFYWQTWVSVVKAYMWQNLNFWITEIMYRCKFFNVQHTEFIILGDTCVSYMCMICIHCIYKFTYSSIFYICLNVFFWVIQVKREQNIYLY